MYQCYFLTLHLLHFCNNTHVYLKLIYILRFDYKLSHNNLKPYRKVLVKALLINFTRTDYKLVSAFAINISFTKTLVTF